MHESICLKLAFVWIPRLTRAASQGPKTPQPNMSRRNELIDWQYFSTTDIWTQLLTISDFLGGKSPWENKRHHPNDMSWTRKPRHLNHYNFRIFTLGILGIPFMHPLKELPSYGSQAQEALLTGLEDEAHDVEGGSPKYQSSNSSNILKLYMVYHGIMVLVPHIWVNWGLIWVEKSWVSIAAFWLTH